MRKDACIVYKGKTYRWIGISPPRFHTLECFQNSCSAFLVPMIFLLCYWILFHGKSLDNENKHMRFVLYFNLLMCTNLKIFMDPRYCKRIDSGSNRCPHPTQETVWGLWHWAVPGTQRGAALERDTALHCRLAKCCRDAITLQRRLVDGEGGW